MSERTPWRVRPGCLADCPTLNDVEQAGDARFADAGMGFVVDCPPAPLDELSDAARDSRLAVAETLDGVPIGFALVLELGGRCHVEQVSVLPEWGGRGIGAALLDWAEDWGRRRGYAEASLRTYRDVGWNAPWYARRGWRIVPEGELDAALASLAETERALGLDAVPRVAMVKTLA